MSNTKTVLLCHGAFLQMHRHWGGQEVGLSMPFDFIIRLFGLIFIE